MKFPKLEAALQPYMNDKETIAAALDWLDISKERDMELFEKLTELDDPITFQRRNSFYEAVSDEIISADSDELYQRFMLMAYKLMDCDAYDIINIIIYKLAAEKKAYVKGLFPEAMKSVYGEEAQARMLSAEYASCVNTHSNCKMPDDPKLILKAAELTSEKHMTTKALLAAAVLDLIPPADGRKLNDEAERAVAFIKNVMENIIEKDDVFLLNALANASYFDKEIKAHFEKYAAAKAEKLCSCIAFGATNIERAADALFAVEGTLSTDVLLQLLRRFDNHEKLLISAAKMQTETFKQLMLKRKNTTELVTMNNALKAVSPDEAIGNDMIKKMSDEKIIEGVASCYKDSDKIKQFLKDEISLGEVYPIIKSTKLEYTSPLKADYIHVYGIDDFILRCVVVLGGSVGRYSHHLNDITGFSKDGIPSLIDWFYSHDTDMAQVLDICSNISENSYYCEYMIKIYADALSDRTDDIAAADISKCSVLAKTLALTLLGNNDVKYRKSIMSLAGDSSKAIRELVADIAVKHPEWKDDIKVLLGSKKSSARVAALDIIERQGASDYKDELKKALAAEKTDKLKARIGSMLSVVSESAVVEEKVSAADLVKEMTKGKKTSKLDWLFKEPFFTVRKKDGTAADESYIKALMLCFANSVGIKDPNADIITAELDEKDVTRLANEVLTKWLSTPPDVKSDWMQFFEEYSGLDTLGAQAKYKWVLYFASVYGGKEALEVFESLMSTWPLYQKGALAKEIPHAIVLNGSSSYIMMVEKMSRKHRFNSIRKASADALLCASEKLGISKEEFADRMIPDLDFDKDMCRIFDYGSRQFKVYISQKLEPEIYCDGKKLKTMPKPNTSDGKQAAEVYKEFTAMKKLMKTVVAAQRVRLENTLLTARTWTTENWKQIFMENPIMHCFATGLIWGIYKDGKLDKSFRYLEDGSLTNVDDEEFTLADDAVIGLVHPVELSKDEPYKWKQQLNDYEIDQPIVQLDRCVYRPTEEEKGQDFIGRFKGNVVKSTELASAMNRIGWSKGQVGDGAIFDDFTKEDIFDRNDGIRASLRHSGIPAEIYRGEVTDVTVDKLVFETLPKQEYIKIGDLSDRYFSEIMYQLRKVFTE